MNHSLTENQIKQIIEQIHYAQQSIQLAQATGQPEQIQQAFHQIEFAEEQLQDIEHIRKTHHDEYMQAKEQLQQARTRAEQTERLQ